MRRICAAALLALTVASAQALTLANFNLAKDADGWGTFTALTQGSVTNLTDGTTDDWERGMNLAPINFNTNVMSPYITWSAQQTVRSVRVFTEFINGAYVSRMADLYTLNVFTLNGAVSGAGTDANWALRASYTNTSANKIYFVDLDLGADYATHGIRTTLTRTNNDVNVGEIEAFAPFATNTTLTNLRLTSSSQSASSERAYWGLGAAQVVNGLWLSDRWLSEYQDVNTGTNFTLTLSYSAPTNVGGLSLAWYRQMDPGANYSEMPTNWEFLANI